MEACDKLLAINLRNKKTKKLVLGQRSETIHICIFCVWGFTNKLNVPHLSENKNIFSDKQKVFVACMTVVF